MNKFLLIKELRIKENTRLN